MGNHEQIMSRIYRKNSKPVKLRIIKKDEIDQIIIGKFQRKLLIENGLTDNRFGKSTSVKLAVAEEPKNDIKPLKGE